MTDLRRLDDQSSQSGKCEGSSCSSGSQGSIASNDPCTTTLVKREYFFYGIADVTKFEEIEEWFPTQASLVRAMRRSRLLYSDMECPRLHCKRNMSYYTKRSSQYSMRICEKHKTPVLSDVTRGTPFSKSKISLRKVFQILFLLSKGESRSSIAKIVGVSLTSVDLWAYRFRKACVKLVDTYISIGGTKEIVYLSLSEVAERTSDTSTVALVGMDRNTGRIFAKIFKNPTERDIVWEAERNLFLFTEVYSDFHRKCPSLKEFFPSFNGDQVNVLRNSPGKQKTDQFWTNFRNYVNDWSKNGNSETDLRPYLAAIVAINNEKNLFKELLLFYF